MRTLQETRGARVRKRSDSRLPNACLAATPTRACSQTTPKSYKQSTSLFEAATFTGLMGPSKTQVDKAGRRLAWLGNHGNMRLAEAEQIVHDFRASHRQALRLARRGLESSISALGHEAEITNRTKRTSSIVDKLTRLPTMRLSSMGDIGGCRAVLPSLPVVYEVAQRLRRNAIRRNGKPPRIIDYVTDPRPTGYRAVHLITPYQGLNIEVQLRTPRQHWWAQWMEDMGLKSEEYRSGEIAPEVADLYRWVSEWGYEEDAGIRPSGSQLKRLAALRDKLGQAIEATESTDGQVTFVFEGRTFIISG
ncbi:MAG: hypothetical protein F4Z02_09225 [Acidimicrobiia bacterium]|nr:hypothetical protein [Acidimicrobiia bacterium]MYG72445.1 hypothetical protein [Acidimicrobiia bacterium]MYL08441.1 hypothetical protein [Acidimicrobiia bacterium]